MENDAVVALTEAAQSLSQAADALAQPATDRNSLILGTFSLGAVLVSVTAAIIVLLVNRHLAANDRRLAEAQAEARRKVEESRSAERLRIELAFEIHERFNSKEVLDAREEAEKLMVRHTGKSFRELRSRNISTRSLYIVAREYEFMSIAIEEDRADRDILAKYAFEIFVFWIQHFRFGFRGEKFGITEHLRELEKFFKKHKSTGEQWPDIERKQRDYINALRKIEDLEPFNFEGSPELNPI